MTISANTVFEVQTGGSDLNGGGFVTGASGSDLTYPTSAPVNLTGVTTAAANAICLHASAAATWVGNICQIVSGTNFTAGLYQIISVVAGVSFTLDRTCTTAAGAAGVVNVGGAFASPGFAAPAASVDGNLIWIKAGTYTLTTATPGAAGPSVYASGARVKMEGYTSTRGDRAGRPVVSAGAVTSVNIFAGNGSDTQVWVHLEADGNSKAGVSGFSIANARWAAIDCKASHCNQASAAGFAGNGGVISRCGAVDCTTGFNLTGSTGCARCSADACGVGFQGASGVAQVFSTCVATDCTGDGFNILLGNACIGCTAEGNAGDGFDCQAVTFLEWCASTNNTGFGYNTAATTVIEGSASFNNSARVNVACIDSNSILLSGDPWTDASTDDLRPDNTAGEGAAIRNAGGGIFGQTDNRDVGAVQHADTSAASAAYVIG